MRRSPGRIAFLLLLLSGLAIPRVTVAGTLCGDVTDRSSGSPVSHAGIFLYENGTYSGISGASDAAGHFCIDLIPPGTYDVGVGVDDYQTAWVRGVVVTGTVSVPLGVDVGGLRLALPSPNPASSTVRLRWVSARPGVVTLAVRDLQGRLVRGWTSRDAAPGAHEVTWNLHDASGRAIAPGVYSIVVDDGASRSVRRFVRAR